MADHDDWGDGGTMPAPAPVRVGDSVGNYVLEDRLGAGGCGEVFVAYHTETLDTVALKVLHAEHLHSGDLAKRFLAEAKVPQQIQHPGIAKVIEFGNEKGLPYIAMELLEGRSLQQLLDDGKPVPEKRALDITLQAARALAAAHQHNVIHRDVKPDNLYLVNAPLGSEVRLLDFGIAKLLDASLRADVHTKTGSIMGTPHYMSPEQCLMRKDIDGRADQYSLGVVLFQMLTGRFPFLAESIAGLIVAHMNETPPDPCTLVEGLSASTGQLVLRMLDKDRTQRWPDMHQVANALEDALHGGVTGTLATVVEQAPPLIEGYRLGRELGSGQVTTSYLAHHRNGRRRGVIKFVHDDFATQPSHLRAYIEEAKRADRINHEGFCSLLKTGTHQGRPFLLTEYIEGESVASVVDRGLRLPEGDVVRIGAQLAAALGAAHEDGLVHGYLSPSNVMLSNGGDAGARAVITDFGIRRMLNWGGGMNADDTPAPHMPPEQLRVRGDLPPTVDVFALGVMLYELLVGEPPFELEPESPARTTRVSTPERRAVPPRTRQPQVTAGMEGVLLKALAPKPRDRFQNMAAFSDGLRYVSASHAEVARSVDQIFGDAESSGRPRTVQERTELVATKLQGMVMERLESGNLELPVMPTAVGRAITMLDNPNSSLRKVAELLDQDPVLATQVLRVANSPIFMGSGKAATIDHAVTRLGAGNLRAVLVECSANQIFQSRVPSIRREMEEIWKHSVAVASVARALAGLRFGPDPALAYIAGLLHDVGKPIVGGVLLEVEKHLAQQDRKFMNHDMWVRVVAEGHRAVGKAAIATWELPEAIIEAIEFCSGYDFDAPKGLSNYVCLANAIAKRERPYSGLTTPEQIEDIISQGCELFEVAEKDLGRFSELAQQAA